MKKHLSQSELHAGRELLALPLSRLWLPRALLQSAAHSEAGSLLLSLPFSHPSLLEAE